MPTTRPTPRCSGTSSDRPARPATRRSGEAGSAAVELVLIGPVLIGIFLLLVQWSLRLEAERAVHAAAREGAVAAARFDGTPEAGSATARDYLERLDPQLTSLEVTVTRGVDVARVRVEGSVLSLLPFLDIGVGVTVEQPVEKFTP